jgi:hypothetical protein
MNAATRDRLLDAFGWIWEARLKQVAAAQASPVAADSFRPVDQLVADAGQKLRGVKCKAFEKLVGVLYEDRSRKGSGGFPPSERINGCWDRSDTEIDLVALNATDQVIRLGSCKRSAAELVVTYRSSTAPAGGSSVFPLLRRCLRTSGKRSNARARSCKI